MKRGLLGVVTVCALAGAGTAGWAIGRHQSARHRSGVHTVAREIPFPGANGINIDPQNDGLYIRYGDGPCGSGQLTAASAARPTDLPQYDLPRLWQHPVLVPHLADSRYWGIRHIFQCSLSSYVMVFDAGLWLEMDTFAPPGGPTTSWYRGARAIMINGRRAVVTEPRPLPGGGTQDGGVWFVRDGFDVRISGNPHMHAKQLIAIAASLAPAQ